MLVLRLERYDILTEVHTGYSLDSASCKLLEECHLGESSV